MLNQRNALYKRCLRCSKDWGSRIDFLTDAKVTLAGYQANFTDLEDGCFIFEHTCGNKITVMVRELSDLYGGLIFGERKTGSDHCPEFCLHGDNLNPCPEYCECAYVREILHMFACPVDAENDF